MKKIIIYGAGRAGKIIKEIFDLQKIEVIGLIDDDALLHGTSKYGLKILGNYNYLLDNYKNVKNIQIIISIAAPNLMGIRNTIYNSLKSDGFSFANAIHPSVIISPSVKIGENNFISPGVIIETNTIIGNNNRICIHSTIDHDCVVGDSNFIGPHSYIASCCEIMNGLSVDSRHNLEPFTRLS